MNLNDVFATNLKKTRLKQHLTQEELSFRCGINKNYLGDLERATRNPTLQVIEKISRGLKVPPATLLQTNRGAYDEKTSSTKTQ